MNFTLKPSLEHIALVQITATLFKQYDIRDLVNKFSNSQLTSEKGCIFSYPLQYSGKQKEWKEIEDKVKDKVPDLSIPTSLKEKLLCYVQSMGIQILRWMGYHFRFCSFDLVLLKGFCWTPLGTIDKKKTAEVLIRDEAIDINTRYKLACIYCLEYAILELWYKLPESYKRASYNGENAENNIQRELLIFWGQYIRKKEATRDNVIRRLNSISFSVPYMLRYAARIGNKAAMEYFLKNLIEKKHSRDKILLKAAIYVAKNHHKRHFYTEHPQEYCSEVFCFLLSQLNDEQQVQLFKKCPIQTLQCLLVWPWQNFFVETANRLSSFFTDNYTVLQMIINKIFFGFKDYNYQKLFQDVWQQMSYGQKNNFLYDSNFKIICDLLLKIKHQESIKFIFQDITLTERKKLIFSDVGQSLFDDLIFQDEWDLLKFCIPLCMLSRNEMVKFKEEFQEYIQRREKELIDDVKQVFLIDGTSEIRKSKQEQFFRFLNGFIHGYDKRKGLTDDCSNPAKKLCNIKYKFY